MKWKIKYSYTVINTDIIDADSEEEAEEKIERLFGPDLDIHDITLVVQDDKSSPS